MKQPPLLQQGRKDFAAPPVYRPSNSAVGQAKAAGAPPVYRPFHAPVGQAKAMSAPPVYRPAISAVGLVRPMAAPAVYRPSPALVGQAKLAPAPPPVHGSLKPMGAPAVYRMPGNLAGQAKMNQGGVPLGGSFKGQPQQNKPVVAPVASRVIQQTRRRVQKPAFNTWWWNDTLAATWQGHNVPLHPCHTTHVGQDQLVGGWTVIDDQGVYQQSGVYGPYTPGMGKDNHVERQFVAAMENALELAMNDDNTFSDVALAVIEVHQWLTPCSGGHGCTTYLNDQVNGFNNMLLEVRACARLSAEYKYNAGVSETHPSHPKQSQNNVTVYNDNNPLAFTGGTVLHNNPTGWW